MKKIILFATLLSFSFSSVQAHDDNNADPTKPKAEKPACAVKIDKEDTGNKIFYSSIAGESLYIQTVDKHLRPLSCLLRINDEDKHQIVPKNGLITFEKDQQISAIHVFHDSKVYDFVPEATEHNKLTLVLDTKNRKYNYYENRARKINNEEFYPTTKSKRKLASCGLQADVDYLLQ